MGRIPAALVWGGLACAVVVPIIVAASSPLLAWRQPIYIIAGFAGVIAMTLLLLQPLLAGGELPGLPRRPGRQVHRWVGLMLVTAVLIHVGGLWITSPPDVVDALLFASPTPFSLWGVIAMWAIFAAALIALIRHRLRPATWRIGHTLLVTVVVTTSVLHALLIEGTMGTVSKVVLCVLVIAATGRLIYTLKTWTLMLRR